MLMCLFFLKKKRANDFTLSEILLIFVQKKRNEKIAKVHGSGIAGGSFCELQ